MNAVAHDDPRVAIAHELFESVRIANRSGEHLRLKAARGFTLCDRDASKVWPVHRTDELCKTCFAVAFVLVDEEANRRMHAAVGTVGEAPYALPSEAGRRRRWLRR